ncbi:extracellular solute-binding protein [Parasphaerochaeta coccoides]|uniref:Extracellular solute-binding protein family 1 n=1 Tax=Parasphaerochaeta coccoides (strain ATCC BAA-1237 / DSM 17374 / SPN1) TaxID=760011 RepID=F4GJ88_PARC1|nr:extracellular solute-binding protein [Parasphaerochaeta coccoides]AEC01728.1 extracellular solute-binding protein family 1 [Parasphaerochaeta coccoides DSM 17374]
MCKRSRIIMAVLLVLLVAGMASAQGVRSTAPTEADNFIPSGTKIVENKITLRGYGSKFAGNAEWDDNMLVWRELEKRTNVRIEWETVVNTEARTKAQTLFAADDLPDLFLKNALNMSDVVKFSASGHLVDLKQYMDAGLMPNFKEAYDNDVNLRIALTTADGKIYTLPAYYPDDIDTTRRFMYVNETWLNRVGKRKPTTLTELYDVLKAFRDLDANGNGDPNDEYPIAFGNVNETEKTARALAGIDDIFGQPFNVINGQLTQMYTSDNMKEAWRFLAKLYAEKYLEPDLFTKTTTEFFARLANDQYGVTLLLPPADSSQFGILEPSFGILGKENVIWNWKVSPLLGVATFAITTKNPYPRETARWIDYLYGDDGSTLVRMGVEGDTYVTNADGSLSYSEKIKSDPQGVEFAMAKYSFWLQPNATPGRYTAKQTLPLFEGTLTPSAIPVFAPYNTKHAYSLPSLPADIERERTTLLGEINKYYSESRAAFMTGKLDIDKDWNIYVTTLKQLKVDRLQEIYRQAYAIVQDALK